MDFQRNVPLAKNFILRIVFAIIKRKMLWGISDIEVQYQRLPTTCNERIVYNLQLQIQFSIKKFSQVGHSSENPFK